MKKFLTALCVPIGFAGASTLVYAEKAELPKPPVTESMQQDGMMGGAAMKHGDMMGMMKMMSQMVPMMEACTRMMSSMHEKNDDSSLPKSGTEG